MNKRPQTSADRPVDTGRQLIEDLQQQCESLRTWQSSEADKLTQREDHLQSQTQELDAIRTSLETELTAQRDANHALQQARKTISKERTKLKEDAAILGGELTRVEDLQARVELDQKELVQMRSELDEEWTSLCRIRRTNEKLASELDAERDRIKKTAGPSLKLTKAA
ncbi:MAG: hypothetical protein V3V20_03925 [Algisphaera sp.]